MHIANSDKSVIFYSNEVKTKRKFSYSKNSDSSKKDLHPG